MPTKIERYNIMKMALGDSERWFEKIGKPYSGGGGGIGELRSMHPECQPEVYYQEYSGAANYHKANDTLVEYINRQIGIHGHMLVRGAIEAMRRDIKELATEAVEEYKLMMTEAGLDADSNPA